MMTQTPLRGGQHVDGAADGIGDVAAGQACRHARSEPLQPAFMCREMRVARRLPVPDHEIGLSDGRIQLTHFQKRSSPGL